MIPTLIVNGEEFGGWTSVEIGRGLDRIARCRRRGPTTGEDHIIEYGGPTDAPS